MGFMTRNVTQSWIWFEHELAFVLPCEIPGRFSYYFQKKPHYTTLWLFAWGINFYCIIFTFLLCVLEILLFAAQKLNGFAENFSPSLSSPTLWNKRQTQSLHLVTKVFESNFPWVKESGRLIWNSAFYINSVCKFIRKIFQKSSKSGF
jgi:hypothetical protein